MATVRNGLVRVVRAWGALDGEQRRAAIAAVALLVTMFLPWYEATTATRDGLDTKALQTWSVLSWVEAAIFLVSLGVCLLLFFRAERRAFHLPGGDGTVIFGAGLWVSFLLFWRVFDRPDPIDPGTVKMGITWGFFFAFLAAGALAYAGFRMRTAGRPEPTRAQDPTTRVEPNPARATAATQVAQPRRRRRVVGTGTSESSTQIAGQLSFEESIDEPPPERGR